MRIKVAAPFIGEYARIITIDALAFLEELHDLFACKRRELLQNRLEWQMRVNARIAPGFLEETKAIREGCWRINPPPKEIERRVVEITAPADNRKMVIKALNCGADVYMADAEDSMSPTWENLLNGQINLWDAVRRTITCETLKGKYQLNEKTAVLMFRPRGLHLEEKHIWIGDEPLPAMLFDLGLFLFHNARALLEKGTQPYIYVPKLESYLEARWVNEVLRFIEDKLQLPKNSIRTTVLIETHPAVYQMNEILYEMKERITGLTCGRWDYIFSFIKSFAKYPEYVLPDRSELTMDKSFLVAYSNLLIQTCHCRGAHAMGGMAAQIPIADDEKANTSAFAAVRADKAREVKAGHDGSWVAHPGLVDVVREVYNICLAGRPNQLEFMPDVNITAEHLMRPPSGNITLKALETNIGTSLEYLAYWLQGTGCVALNHLMLDVAIVELGRAQIWQWLHHGYFTHSEVARIIGDETERLAKTGKFKKPYLTAEMFYQLVTDKDFVEFLTIPAYEMLLKQ